MNLLLFRELQYSVDSFGLTGLDKLLSFMIVKELQVSLVWFSLVWFVSCSNIKANNGYPYWTSKEFRTHFAQSPNHIKCYVSAVCKDSPSLSQKRSSLSRCP